MTTHTELAIMIDWDGDDHSGSYDLYPANDESEPDFDFCSSFTYGPDEDYDSRDDAREAAEAEAERVADRIGGQWFSNE